MTLLREHEDFYNTPHRALASTPPPRRINTGWDRSISPSTRFAGNRCSGTPQRVLDRSLTSQAMQRETRVTARIVFPSPTMARWRSLALVSSTKKRKDGADAVVLVLGLGEAEFCKY